MEDILLILGIGCLMMCPMIFGAITMVKSVEASKMWWED
jgi:hypothetical protein